MKSMDPYRSILIAGFVLLLILFVPLGMHFYLQKVTYNQFIIQSIEWNHLNLTPDLIVDTFSSLHSSGLNILFNNPLQTPPPFSDQDGIFWYVFSNAPTYAIVYPTEGFYYYNFIHPVMGKVSGNMRIADLDKGEMSVAYFTAEDKNTIIFDMTTEKGLRIEKLDNYNYAVGYRNKTIRFKIPKTDFSSPKNLKLLPEEEFVGQIHDESDVRLFLLYNHRTHSFYEILNEENGVSDTFYKVNNHLLIGERTSFAYYHDLAYDRKILVGVFLPNVESNNFFDGPGDQVPFRANVKSKINAAYPNTLLESGTDEHGVYLDKPYWVRIAISPYLRYGYLDEIFERVGSCQADKDDASLYWTCLTKEWWNHAAWRKGIYTTLLGEGKIFTIPGWEPFTVEEIAAEAAKVMIDSNAVANPSLVDANSFA